MRSLLSALIIILFHNISAQEVKVFERDSFYLEFPANWKIDMKSKNYEPDSSFSIIEKGRKNHVDFFLKYKNTNTQKVVEGFIELAQSTLQIKKPEFSSFTNWGNFSGNGEILKGKFMGTDIIVLIFAYSENNRSFAIMEYYIEGKMDKLRDEFGLIANSFKFKGSEKKF